MGNGKRDGSAEIKIGQVNRPKEGIVGDSRVKHDINSSERSSGRRRRVRGWEAITSRGTAHPPINVRPKKTRVTWEEERRRGPFLLHHPVIVGGGGGVSVNGGESVRRLYELNELGVVPNQPLFAMQACDG